MNEIDHPLSSADRIAMTAFRAQAKALAAAQAGKSIGLDERRRSYNAMVSQTAVPDGVGNEAAVVAGVPGFWCRPQAARPKSAIVYIHGGAYMLGAASAYQNFAGQIAIRCGVGAFVVDYRLAPEHPFPAAVEDCAAAYRGLLDAGYDRLALVGDSAGGALSLATIATARSAGRVAPRVSVIFSPWTDLALTGSSYDSKAQADPIFTKAALAGPAALYLDGHSDRDPLASPLYADVAALPPLQVHTGTEELLLDDTLRYVERARAAGSDATAHIWAGMPHVFARSVNQFEAASGALDLAAGFILKHL